jgi:hypothetical protein
VHHYQVWPVSQHHLLLLLPLPLLLQFCTSRGIAPGPNATQQHPNPYVAAFVNAAGDPAAAAAAAFAGAAGPSAFAAAAATPAGGVAFGTAGAAGGQVLFGKAAQQPQQQQQGFGSAGKGTDRVCTVVTPHGL